MKGIYLLVGWQTYVDVNDLMHAGMTKHITAVAVRAYVEDKQDSDCNPRVFSLDSIRTEAGRVQGKDKYVVGRKARRCRRQ